MGSGKTISTLWAFDYLRRIGAVRKMLVISPLSTLERTWGDEIFSNFPDMSFAVLHGSRDKRHKLIETDVDVYIINHDGIKSKDTLDLLIEKDDIDLVVVDEVASFRNSGTERYKSLKRLTAAKPWVWGLTGTPTPNAPTDAWAQCRLVNPSRVTSSFRAFRDQVMRQVTTYKWSPKDDAMETVRRSMQPAVRFSREECIDLPPTTFVTRHVDLTSEQKQVYDMMMRDLRAEYEGGEVVAMNEAAKLSKILQTACGVVYGSTENITLPVKPRVDLVREIIEESEGKVIVFVPLTGALEMLKSALETDYSVAVVHGGTPRAERDQVFGDFQKQPHPRVLVANPATMSHGLTLTAASTIIWYAPVNSAETYQQACARIVRPGQKRNTLIANIESTPVERRVYARLQSREKMQGVLLDLMKKGET